MSPRTLEGESRLNGAASSKTPENDAIMHADKPVYVISVAAELAGMHAQTLRQYDRLGLVTPERTGGGGRRYSMRDIERLREVQELSSDGVSLAGIRRIMELEHQVRALTDRLSELQEENERHRQVAGQRQQARVFAAGRDGIVALRPGERARRERVGSSLVLYRNGRS